VFLYLDVFPKFSIAKTWSLVCADNFIQNQREILLHNRSHISLAPSNFRNMSKLPEPTITFKRDEAISFIKVKNNELELLQENLEDLSTIPEDIS
jgi:hypothetical protein